MKVISTLVVFIFLCHYSNSQTWTDMHLNLPGLQSGCAAFADYDLDGDQDLIVEGFSSTFAERGFLYRNDNGVMTVVDSSLIKISNGSVNWGDYDNDGDPDLLINGQINGGGACELYRNDSGNFVATNLHLPKIIGVQRWIDYDNDGWLDIISAGLIDSIWVDTTILHRNNGNGTFTTVPTNIPSFEGNDLQVYDYDHDSLPDLFVTGRTPVFINAFTALFHNTGNGNFTMDTASFRQLWTGTAKWGDLENDGDADILVDGIMNDNSFFTEIYLNDGAGNFTVQVNNLPGSGEPGTVDWADMDDDGDLDVLIGGTYLMRNDSNGVFTDVSPWFTGAFYLPAIFNDYDNDGDEDIFLLNYFGNDESTILRNDLLTGIPILQNKPTFSIFPNPVKSKATIKSGNEDIIYNLYSPDSRFIRSFIGKNTFQIDISGISSGVYFLTDESKKSFIRIVIE